MKQKRILSVVALLLAAVLLVACGGGGTAEANKEDITLEAFRGAYDNLASVKGKYMEFTAKASSATGVGEGYEAVFYLDKDNYKYAVLAKTSNTDVKIEKEKYYKVHGKITGTKSGADPIIEVDSIAELSYIEAMVPTIKEIVPANAAQTQHGVSVTIAKVEFAEKETRVYVSVSNNSKEEYSLYKSSTKLIQGGSQLESEPVYTSKGYKELPSDVLPGVSTDGVLVYKNIEQTDFNIIIKGTLSNYWLDFKDFNIPIVVPAETTTAPAA